MNRDDILEKDVSQTGIDEKQLSTDVSQEELLQMFLHAAGYKEDESLFCPITIRRGGAQLLPTFRVRPLSQEEINRAHRKATKLLPNPAGRRLPPIEGDTDASMERSWTIYLATVDEDKRKLWDNIELQKGMQARHPEVVFSKGDAGAQLIKMVLSAGESSAVVSKIVEISFPDNVLDDDSPELTEDEYAKN